MSKIAGLYPEVHGRGAHGKTVRLGNSGFIQSLWGFGGTAQVAVANRVYVFPMWIPRGLTVNEAAISITVGSAGKNVRLGLYANNNMTPTGGLLLFDSGNLSAAVAGAIITAIAPLRLSRGVVWGAVATEDNVITLLRVGGNVYHIVGTSVSPMLESCHYDLGAWGALTNPCPAVTLNSSARIYMLLNVASVDE